MQLNLIYFDCYQGENNKKKYNLTNCGNSFEKIQTHNSIYYYYWKMFILLFSGMALHRILVTTDTDTHSLYFRKMKTSKFRCCVWSAAQGYWCIVSPWQFQHQLTIHPSIFTDESTDKLSHSPPPL